MVLGVRTMLVFSVRVVGWQIMILFGYTGMRFRASGFAYMLTRNTVTIVAGPGTTMEGLKSPPPDLRLFPFQPPA